MHQAFNLTCHGRAELSQPQESDCEDGIAYDIPIGREEHEGVCINGEVENEEEVEQVEVGKRDGPAKMTMTGLHLTRKRCWGFVRPTQEFSACECGLWVKRKEELLQGNHAKLGCDPKRRDVVGLQHFDEWVDVLLTSSNP